MKKISSLITVFTFVLLSIVLFTNSLQSEAVVTETTAWDGTTITQPTTIKTVDGVYYYEISTAEELAYIAQTGGNWLGYNYILVNDISLNSVELTYDNSGNLTIDASTLNQWTPISGFSGVFNGNGFSISGVYVNTTSSAGFFSNCNGDVLNLTIKNSYIKGGSSVGGICGSFCEGGKDMDNCFYDGAVVGVSNVGGLIGSNYTTNISNCGNYGNVWGTGNYVCGIVGEFYAYGIDDCFNEGNIYSTGNYVAGIAGSSDIYYIRGCVNKGKIEGNDYVGGICGQITNAGIISCGNTGEVIGKQYVGGICGHSKYRHITAWTSNIADSYNTGDVTGESYVGGITGYTDYANVEICYSVGNVAGTEIVGAVIGHSESIWGHGTVCNCYYLKNDTVNTALNGFGNVEDADDIVNAQDDSFFCINSDKTLNKSGHTYSEMCDTTCDNCGYVRNVVHNYKNLRHDADKHWYECDCGEIDSDNVVSHSGGPATCVEKAICEVCKQSYGNLGGHNFDENSLGYTSPDGHAHLCKTNGCNEHDTIQAHTSSGPATEVDAEECIECGYIITPTLRHTHSAKTEWESNDTYHWHSCTGCEGQQLNKGTHNDSDNNSKCDTCGATVPVGTIGEPDDNNETNDEGLSAGAIARIAIGSVAVIGIGGFCISWFVIRKKKLADLNYRRKSTSFK